MAGKMAEQGADDGADDSRGQERDKEAGLDLHKCVDEQEELGSSWALESREEQQADFIGHRGTGP